MFILITQLRFLVGADLLVLLEGQVDIFAHPGYWWRVRDGDGNNR